jgi:ankyrin repeat protein
MNGIVDCVKLFLDLRDDIHQVDEDGKTLLMHASRSHSNTQAIIHLLVSRGANIHAKDRE